MAYDSPQPTPADPNAATYALAAEIAALTGCSEKAAAVAAGSFIHFPDAPGYGLRDHSDERLAAQASIALRAWVAAKSARRAA